MMWNGLCMTTAHPLTCSNGVKDTSSRTVSVTYELDSRHDTTTVFLPCDATQSTAMRQYVVRLSVRQSVSVCDVEEL